MDNKFSLTQSDPDAPWFRRRWKSLSDEDREQILSYDFVVQELSGFSGDAVRGMFSRMNRYVVALNPQELRHASDDGPFKRLVEEVGSWPFWIENGVVTRAAAARMKDDELVAELLILLNEGPQDKKGSVDLYYSSSDKDFSGPDLSSELGDIVERIGALVPDLSRSPYRRPPALYALIGAISEILDDDTVSLQHSSIVGARLAVFAEELSAPEDERTDLAVRYLLAQSRQTDNIRPRRTRIEILRQVILGAG